MITHTVLNVEINNKTMPNCIGLQLSQPIHGHHFFRIEYSGKSIESDPISLASDSVKLVGTQVKLGFSNSKGEARVFWGVVTAVHAVGNNQAGYTQNIIFEGYSPTILLENGPSCHAYADMGLSEMVMVATKAAPANVLTVVNKPRHRDKLGYTVQYNESDFAFINRMARRFGEWLYFDGLDLVFGDKAQPTLELLYGYNLHHFDFSMNTSSVSRKFSAYGYKGNEILQGATKTSDSSLNGMVAQAMKASEKTWQPAQAAFLHQFDDETALKSQVDTLSRLNIQASAANRVTFTGSSSHPGLFPGAVINVKTIAPEDHREFGRYVITSINHRFRDGGNYQNQFEAVPFDVEVSPLTNTTAFPICSPQSGKVIDNNDPEGLGRVKVQLQWQRNSPTPWLRISTPYAGSDKGMFFVPEIGEEVVVGFENSNAEKPYVMGSLYHGKAKPDSFVTDKNDIKAIRTRTGHTIEFNDTDGDEKIIITDKNQNFIKINTSTNDIHISSGNDLKLSAKNIQFDATENIYVGAGKNMNCSIGETFNVMAKDVNEHVENEVISSSKKSETNSEEVTINSTSKNLTLASNKSVDIQSNEKVKLF